MDEIFLYFAGSFWLLALLIYFSKLANIRGADIVQGKVVNIRTNSYSNGTDTIIIEIESKTGALITRDFRPKTRWVSYSMNQTVNCYEIKTRNGYDYKIVVGYFTIVWVLMVAPIFSLISIAFES